MDLELNPARESVLVNLAVFDGERWHDAVAAPRTPRANRAQDPNNLEPAYRADRGASGIRVHLGRIPEGSIIKISGELIALQAGESWRWSSPALCEPPARSMSVRLWSDAAEPSARTGPPRPTWIWDGTDVSGPPTMWTGKEATEQGVADENLAMVRFRPVSHDHAEEPKTLAVLVDTSASQSTAFERNLEHLHGMLMSLRQRASPGLHLWVVAFDQTAKTIYRGDLRDYRGEVRESLRRRRPLGATNLEAGLRFLASHGPDSFDRLLLVSDGMVTAGESEPEVLRARVRGLESRGLRRIDVLAGSPDSNPALLTALVDEPRRPGALLSPRESPRRAAGRMLRTVGHVMISSPDATAVFPSAVARVQEGDEIIVAAFGVAKETLRLEAYEVVEGIRRETTIPLHRTGAPSLASYARVVAFERWRSQLQLVSSEPTVAAVSNMTNEAVTRGLFNEWTALKFVSRSEETMDGEAAGVKTREGPSAQDRLWRGRGAGLEGRSWMPRSTDRVMAWRAKSARAGTGLVGTPSEVTPAASEGRVGDSPRSQPVKTAPLTPDRSARPSADARRGGERSLVHYGAGSFEDGGLEQGGPFSTVLSLLGWGDAQASADVADAWFNNDPENLLSILAVAVVAERAGDHGRAGRAFGSLIDLYPHRDDVRRFAARSLVRLGAASDRLSYDALRRADQIRPRHPTSARGLAIDSLARGDYAGAAAQMQALIDGEGIAGVAAPGPRARASLVTELAMILAGWEASRPEDAQTIATLRRRRGVSRLRERTILVALGWDAQSVDMDLHLRDTRGNHAYYRREALPSGGTLTEDASGAFPYEAFVLPAGANAAPYELSVEVHDAGPLGVATGAVDILFFEPGVGLRVEQRPFVVTRAQTRVTLGGFGTAPPKAPASGGSRDKPEIGDR